MTFFNKIIVILSTLGMICLIANCKLRSENHVSATGNANKTKRLDQLYFLIHGFCYAEMAYHKDERDIDAQFKNYLKREKKCAQRWRSKLNDLSDTEALIIIPWHDEKNGPASDYNSLAASILGDRCFILDWADPLDNAFWSDNSDDFCAAVSGEFKSALVQQKDRWNKEELLTALHSLACCRQFNSMLKERGYYFDKRKVNAESWGASFDGCVTKYSLNLRRILGLSNVIEINFDMTVPDAFFLLEPISTECILLTNGLRLYIFKAADQTIALYTMTLHSLENQAVFVKLKFTPKQVTIKSKQGIRLWPQPEKYHLPNASIGCYEPPQKVVKFENGRLYVPVSAGFVYRLTKAPAYIFAGPEITCDEFRAILMRAEIG